MDPTGQQSASLTSGTSSNALVQPGIDPPASNDASAAATAALASVPAALFAAVYELRYHGQISTFDDCPPAGAGGHTEGFRICFADVADSRNFLPNAILDINRTDGRAPKPCCSSYALSMFTSLDTLVDQVRRLKKTIKKLAEKKGDHYVALSLGSGDGRSTTSNSAGHFDFFEYTTFHALSRVKQHAKLPL